MKAFNMVAIVLCAVTIGLALSHNDGGSCAIDADRVTHWMPLPELPEEEEHG